MKAGQKVAFPTSDIKPIGTIGAMEIKAAWRILDAKKGDDLSRTSSCAPCPRDRRPRQGR